MGVLLDNALKRLKEARDDLEDIKKQKRTASEIRDAEREVSYAEQRVKNLRDAGL